MLPRTKTRPTYASIGHRREVSLVTRIRVLSRVLELPGRDDSTRIAS